MSVKARFRDLFNEFDGGSVGLKRVLARGCMYDEQ